MDKSIKLNSKFRTDTPVMPNVKLIETWAYHDGPLFGICEIHGQQLFFIDVIYDIWRYYEDDTHQRLWAIYGVYDITIADAKKIIDTYNDRSAWQGAIEGLSECVGIFWEYEKVEE